MFHSDLFSENQQLHSIPLTYTIGAKIAEHLASGCHLTRADISALFSQKTGVQDWGSAWTIDDYNNAAEIGALLWLRDHSRIDLTTGMREAEARFDWLDAALPPRHVRSEAQVELQQFSTPPMLAWLMAKAAVISPQDSMLEPSSGNGAIAIWMSAHQASLQLNEIDFARRNNLRHIFPEAQITAHDGELIADLHRGPAPSVVSDEPSFCPQPGARPRWRFCSPSSAQRDPDLCYRRQDRRDHARKLQRIALSRCRKRYLALSRCQLAADVFPNGHGNRRADGRVRQRFRMLRFQRSQVIPLTLSNSMTFSHFYRLAHRFPASPSSRDAQLVAPPSQSTKEYPSD